MRLNQLGTSSAHPAPSAVRKRAGRLLGMALAVMAGAMPVLDAPAYAATDAPQRYRIAPGDELELLVVRLPQLSATATVTDSGEVSFPLVGVIDAAGRELDEVRQAVRSILSNKVLDGFDPAQPSAMVLLDPEEVDVRVSIYRPVFVDGDVENRGAIAYRPGMSVRQAVVEAGGYAVDRYLLEDNGVTEAALRANFHELWIDYISQKWRIWSLKSELGQEPGEQPKATDYPVVESSVDVIGRNELMRMDERKKAFDTLIENLDSARTTAEARLSLLEQQLDTERSAVDYDKAELERAEGLLNRGTGTRTRVADIRRTLLVSQARFLEVQSQLAEYERDAQAARMLVATARSDRRVEILDELTEVEAQHATTRQQIESMASRLRQKTKARSVLPVGSTSTSMRADVSFSIFRAATGQLIENASPTETIKPGDVLEVTMAPLKL